MLMSDMHEIIAEKLFLCGAEEQCFMELFRREEAIDYELEKLPKIVIMGQVRHGRRDDLLKRLNAFKQENSDGKN